MSDTSGGTQLSMTSAAPGPPRGGRRVLVCTPFAPRLDARHGGKATAQLLLRLAERNEIGLLALRTMRGDRVDPAIADRCALVHEVVAPAAGSPHSRRLAWSVGLLRGLPPWATDCRSGQYAQALERLLDEWRPDLVEIHLQAMAQYVDAPARRGIPCVLVDYDPASTWADELRGAASGPRRLVRRLEASAWRRYERATRPRFDAIVVFAERDLGAVRPTAGGAIVTRVPLAVDVPERPLDPVGTEPPTIVFVGSFGHPPNVDAALWLAGTIFPRVAALVPEARLELVGHAPGEEVLALAGGAVSVHASVPDVTPYLDRAAVVVAPIRIGGSMRGKVLEALAAGKALVATPRAAEGVEAVDGEHLVVADGEDELVEAVVGLLLDRARRRRLGESARRWAESNLGWKDGVAAFEKLYDAVAAPRERCG
jgi:glycosyltransferase involved in cell wall biosynthesis